MEFCSHQFCDVIDDDGSSRASVVHRSQRVELKGGERDLDLAVLQQPSGQTDGWVDKDSFSTASSCPQKSQPIYCDTSVTISIKLGLHYCTIQLKSIRHCVETPTWCWWSNFSFYLHSLFTDSCLLSNSDICFLPDKRSKMRWMQLTDDGN